MAVRAYWRCQLLANATIATARVGSYPCAARLVSPLWPLAHIQGGPSARIGTEAVEKIGRA
jgi:hypothetical protein